MEANIKWIGVDWGTTNLRAYAVNHQGSLIDELESDKGMGRLKSNEFENALIDLIEPWLHSTKVIPVFACGMVGARQGWQEANYRSVPCQPVTNSNLTHLKTSDPRIHVQVLPGLSQASPPDVMRGEETQIAGFLSNSPDFSGAICLPGTHSKWVKVYNGVVDSFQTFMTGELFDLIATQSVLRHSVAQTGEDLAVFTDAAKTAIEKPETTLTNLFGIRASFLLENTNPEAERARLSGMIIGQEIGLARHFWQDKSVVIIGSNSLVPKYSGLLKSLVTDIHVIPAKEATLCGLSLIAGLT